MENKKTRKEHIEAWKVSGLNRKQYALAEGLNYGTFKGWVYERKKSTEDRMETNKNKRRIKRRPRGIKKFFLNYVLVGNGRSKSI
ncbi:MAG TPA: hypothetical protein PLX69_24595 [Leptospiraceae bacterium]|nr:hypothetical protein [Leptospiraceae bacterium]HRG77763.1 hypothetical protein [Leptospiraceae bacterium]